MTDPRTLIVYACPTGPLAEQIATFRRLCAERFGPNEALAYPPHITLTGFFHADGAAIGGHVAALAAAHAALAAPPPDAIAVSELATTATFHGLLFRSPWLEGLAADFAGRAAGLPRRDAIRLKSWLHLSLAYGFAPAEGPALGELARASVDPGAPVGWELRFYERLAGGAWELHRAWSLV